ncbi:putative quinol monooxygenase [Shimia sagamensis]|uniref:Quinol monooxygenase YgiN n=1 Tax=Shimia sagamensis TaxID=1566352 RepID=A0ABY1P0L0_9RHOB|nr:antibiotic biosynthesis monooxygenase [Shimia sagamensis]SMP23501.1 Quinol monooxygenase YgiN [Shimia sagamensis]
MTVFVVVAEVEAGDGHEEAMAAELKLLTAASRAEAGCVQYSLCEEEGATGQWLIYEVWQSEMHWRQHLETDAFRAFKFDVVPSIGRLSARKFRPVR